MYMCALPHIIMLYVQYMCTTHVLYTFLSNSRGTGTCTYIYII